MTLSIMRVSSMSPCSITSTSHVTLFHFLVLAAKDFIPLEHATCVVVEKRSQGLYADLPPLQPFGLGTFLLTPLFVTQWTQIARAASLQQAAFPEY